LKGKVRNIKERFMFSFSIDHKVCLSEIDPNRFDADNCLSKLIIDMFFTVYRKLLHPCHVSGMYFFQDFEQ